MNYYQNNLQEKYNNLKKKYLELQTYSQNLQTHNEKLQNQNRDLQNELKEIESINRENFKNQKLAIEKLKKELENKSEENKQLKQKKAELEKENANFQKENASLSKENYKINRNKDKSLEENKEYKMKITQLNNILKSKEEEIKKFNNLRENYIKNEEDSKAKIDALSNELKQKSDKYGGALNHFEDISNQVKELKDIESKYKEVLKENTNLKRKNENILANTSTKEKFRVKDPIEFYDVIIEIDSINKLNKTGWKIHYNEKRKEIYEKITQEETLKIGVLGLNNVGKSFILSLLAGGDIEDNMFIGWSIETKGISIKYTEGEKNSDKSICLLDSAGFETPLLNDEILGENKNNENNLKNSSTELEKDYNDKLEEIAKDKGQTERFIEELIITLSDILIIVVGKLTRREQNLISRIKDIIHEKNNEKEELNYKSIIIVHNLSHYNEIEEVDNHINQLLKRSATFKISEKGTFGIQEYEGRNFFAEEDDTLHYIMARQGSNAGDYYNKLTISLIKSKYNDRLKRKKIDIPNEIVKLFSNMSKDIIEDNISLKNLRISNDGKTIILSEENQDYNSRKKDLVCQKTYTDEMGKYNSNKFSPKYSYYAYKEKSEDKRRKIDYILLLRIEIPGKIDKLTASYKKNGSKKTIEVKVTKTKDDFPELKSDNFIEIQDKTRTYGELTYYLEIPKEIDLIAERPMKPTQVYKFKFNNKNIDSSSEDEEDNNENEEEQKSEIIASGVYVLKYSITQASWINLQRKYGKINKKTGEEIIDVK